MIVDSFDNLGAYSDCAIWKKAVDFVMSCKIDIPLGKTEIQGTELFALVSEYQTKPISIIKAEAHRKYIDIQVLLSGRETIYWHQSGLLTSIEPYNAERDIEFYKFTQDKGTGIELYPGMAAVFFPSDIHTPQIAHNDKVSSVKKVVMKIAVDAFFKKKG